MAQFLWLFLALSLLAPFREASAALADGDIVVASRAIAGEDSIVVVKPNGAQETLYAIQSPLLDCCNGVAGLAHDPGTNRVFVAIENSLNPHRDHVFALDGDTGAVVATSQEGLELLRGLTEIALDPADGSVIAVGPGRVVRLSPDLGAVDLVSQFNLLATPSGVTVSGNGRFAYVADDDDRTIVEVDLSNGAQRLVAEFMLGSLEDTLGNPHDIAMSARGTLIVSETLRINEVDPASGKVTFLVLDPGLGFMSGIALQNDDEFVVTDSNSDTIYRVTRGGSVAVVSSGGLVARPKSPFIIGGGGPGGGGGGGGGGAGRCATIAACRDQLVPATGPANDPETRKQKRAWQRLARVAFAADKKLGAVETAPEGPKHKRAVAKAERLLRKMLKFAEKAHEAGVSIDLEAIRALVQSALEVVGTAGST